jgi:amino acid transporter
LAQFSFCAIGLGQLATRIPSAGGIYAYAARSLGARVGFVTGWLYAGSGLLLPGANSLLGGWFVNGFVGRELGVWLGWDSWTLFFAVCVGLLAYIDVRVSARATIGLGILGMAIFLALGLYMVATGHWSCGLVAAVENCSRAPAASASTESWSWQRGPSMGPAASRSSWCRHGPAASLASR